MCVIISDESLIGWFWLALSYIGDRHLPTKLLLVVSWRDGDWHLTARIPWLPSLLCDSSGVLHSPGKASYPDPDAGQWNKEGFSGTIISNPVWLKSTLESLNCISNDGLLKSLSKIFLIMVSTGARFKLAVWRIAATMYKQSNCQNLSSIKHEKL